MNLDVLHGLYKSIQTLVRIIEKPLTGDNQLPLAVPYRPTNESVVGKVRKVEICVPNEYISCGDSAECLVLPYTEEFLTQ